MPLPPYARLRVALDGGAPNTGEITATYGQSVQLSGESTSGWTAQKYEIYSYPSGFSLPSGWTAAGNIYEFTGAAGSLPTAFALPANGLGVWGKWLLRLTVNNGDPSSSQLPAAQFKDSSTVIEIVSPAGLHDLAYQEENQYEPFRRWAGDQAANLRVIDPSIRATFTSTGAAYETVTALTYTVPDATTVEVEYVAIGRASSEYAKYVRVASFTRLSGGSAQLDWDVPAAGSPKEIDSVWDARINLSTNDLQFQVKANSDNPNWKLMRIVRAETLP